MKILKFYLALWLSQILHFFINIIASEKGTTFPGKLALMIDKNFIRNFNGVDKKKTIFITGTNGKSTTTNLLAQIFKEEGITAAVNLEGSNLLAGVAATMLKNATIFGKIPYEYIIMETDERFLFDIIKQIPAKWICITNIQKDQVQRNGEPDIIYQKIINALEKDTVLFLNNDEPNSASLCSFVNKSIFFGVEKNIRSFNKKNFYKITMPCPVCGAPIHFSYYNIDNIGKYKCSQCTLSNLQIPDYFLHHIEFNERRFMVEDQSYPMPYDAPHFLYCYIAAIAIAQELGISVKACTLALRNFINIGGRLEGFKIREKTIQYIRIKQENPETLQNALDYIAIDKSQKIIMIGLDELIDFHPHYTNTFYAFDCDFDQLISSGVEKYICFSDTVAFDTANRLIYSGIPMEKISVLPTNNNSKIFTELSKYDCNNIYLITWLYKFKSLKSYLKNNPI